MQVRDVFCTFWVYSAMARAFAKFKQTVDWHGSIRHVAP